MSEMPGIEASGYYQDELTGFGDFEYGEPEDPLASILTPEVIEKALDDLWHGTCKCCPFCGHKKAGFPYYPLPPGKEDEA